jgi:hypothetical protein
MLITFGLLFFMGLCKKWSNDYNEEFKLFPDDDREFVCSKNCCATEWKGDNNTVIDGVDYKKYQATNLNCSDGVRDVGCICLPKQEL